MKIRKVVEIVTESYDEEQYVLQKMPGLWWEFRDGNTVFYAQEERENEVLSLKEEMERNVK